MFALRSIAQSLKDRAGSARNFGSEADGDDGEVRDGAVEVAASKVSAVAKVEGGSHDLLKGPDGVLYVLRDLKRAERKAPGAKLEASVELEANVAFSSTSASALSSAVKTSSFLFEQLLGDLDALSKRPEPKTKLDRTQMVEDFHAHMTEAMQRLEGRAAQVMGREFTTVEAIMSEGAERYIASIRDLMRKDFDDVVTVWYRGLKYDALVPVENSSASGPSYATVGSQAYEMTCGKVVGLLSALRSALCASAAPGGDAAYERLDVQGNMRVKPVLKNITGRLEAGRLTLVLGPPGCGKTSFLKAIAGQLHTQKGVSAKVSGELRYNWMLVESLEQLCNWSTYVGQVDEHLPLLTVRETLEFAYRCRREGRVRNPDVQRIFEKRIGKEAYERMRTMQEMEVEFVLAVLGLSQCADTIIGNATLKGVSGGEKRRVTLGEMLVTGAQVCALDEISTGLDSAATFDICRYLSACAHFLGQMVVVALLQPPPEVIDLFDDIVLLAEGNVMYHGPRENVIDYFERLGYRCPPRKDLGDFLQELPTSTGESFLMSEAERDAAGAPKRPPRTPDEFGAAWKGSTEGQQMDEAVSKEAQAQFEKEEARSRTPDPEENLTYDDLPPNSMWAEFLIVLAWQWRLKLSNKAEIAARVVQNLVMGLIFGSLFWQIGYDEWYLKAMIFAQMPSFMQAGGIGSVPKLVQERPIIYKQLSAKFYGPASFVLAQALVQVPFSIFDAMAFGNLIYFCTGLVLEPYRYVIFMVLAIEFGLCIMQMMRIFSYAVRNESAALVGAVLSFLLFLIFSGQLATPDVIPGYFKWLFWANPMAWVYRAMAINEFKAAKYGGPGENTCSMEVVIGGQPQKLEVPYRCGDFYLRNRQFETDEAYVLLTVALLAAYLVVFLVVTIFMVHFRRFDRAYTEAADEETAENAGNGEAAAGADNGIARPPGEHPVPMHNFARTESLAVSMRTLVFSDLWYTIPLSSHETDSSTVDLLKGVSGWALPGRMVALMGSSGAGKSTLLDVLADRKTTGVVSGHILVNSAPPDRATFRRIVGYVEQFGVHATRATVLESLLFSARLRLPPRAQHKVESFVHETMELLELGPIKDELTTALSVEENKRLTIAVELVANPSILFADEPTSGLDARAASIVMRSIQNVARSGRTVICTIHQPSIAVFSMFDDLLLMRRGGEVVFFGELGDNAKNLIEYFEAIPGTSPCPVGFNPATWMLDVIGAGTSSGGSDAVDYAAIYQKSKLAQTNRARLNDEFGAPESRDTPLQPASYVASASQNLVFSPVSASAASGDLEALMTPLRRRVMHSRSVRARNNAAGQVPATTASFMEQMWLLLVRNSRTYWRSPEFSLSRLMVILLVSVIITLTFWQQKYSTAADTQSRISAVSFMIFLAGTYSLYTAIPFSMEKRALFYRETSSGMYSKLASVASDGLVEVPLLLAVTIIGVNVQYWGIHFSMTSAEPYLYFSAMFFLYVAMMTTLGQFFAALMPDAMSAQLVASVIVQIFQLFAGSIVPLPKLPVYYKFLYYLSPQKWCQEGVITTQFHGDDTLICDPSGKVVSDAPAPYNNRFCTATGHFDMAAFRAKNFTGVAKTAEDFVYAGDQAFLGYDYDQRWWDLLVVLAWIVLIRIGTGLAVVFIDHNKR